jgi:hypothetical protein
MAVTGRDSRGRPFASESSSDVSKGQLEERQSASLLLRQCSATYLHPCSVETWVCHK